MNIIKTDSTYKMHYVVKGVKRSLQIKRST